MRGSGYVARIGRWEVINEQLFRQNAIWETNFDVMIILKQILKR
jgi:hypothetical protein